MFVLPYNKDNPVRKTPWVVFALIFINGIVLIGEYVGGPPQTWFTSHGFIPEHASLATAFTSMFLHAGFWHYAGNMFFLWMFGNRVENMFGRWLFVAAYLVSGFGATYFYYVLNLHSTVPSVGASGAISGIVGCFLVLFPKTRFDLDFYLGWWRLKSIETHAFAAVLTWFGEQTVLGLLSSTFHVAGGVAYWAHFGGFVVGAIIALAFSQIVDPKEREIRDVEESESRLQPKAEEYTELKL
ncbi:MAG: rhomboid family intrarane serine protease [Candidatus Acidoferrum typicum]|nr:rhomboid family intrarane serine protease [Candidatus Acidoferrum typicum]